MRVEESVCLVTGAARRVGRTIALALAARGARLIIHFRHSEEEARAAADECTRLSGQPARCLRADQSDPDAVERAVEEAIGDCGRIDVLVNSASCFEATPFLQTTRAQWDRMFETNLRGPAWFCRCVAPGMVERGRGVILNIADVCGDAPWVGYLPYCVSKAGLVSLTRGLARELAPAVRVNAVGPGTVLVQPGPGEAEERRRAERSALLGRLGTPQDIAAACLFLIESDYITGAFLPVDGGKHLRLARD